MAGLFRLTASRSSGLVGVSSVRSFNSQISIGTRIIRRSFHKSSIVQAAGKCAGKEYNYFKVPHVSKTHYWGGEIMMTVMWLWIFYRAKHDL